jgi:dipeptidyl aminopeptidase/acylaminoacyl peptidase
MLLGIFCVTNIPEGTIMLRGKNKSKMSLVALTLVLNPLVALSSTAHLGTPAVQVSTETKKRQIGVTDAIEMTCLGDSDDSLYNSPAHYSPDGKRFFILLKKADLKEDKNEFQLFFYDTEKVFRSPEPDAQLSMSSTSNRDAIHDVRWLGDSQSVAFIGENPGEKGQVYTFDVAAHRLERRTDHASAVTTFDITSDEREIAFVAEPQPKSPLDSAKVRQTGLVITTNSVWDLLRGTLPNWTEYGLFLQRSGSAERQVALGDEYAITHLSYWVTPHLSPDGQHVLVYANRRNSPAQWHLYRDKGLQYGLNVDNGSGYTNVHVLEYLVVDFANGSVKSLLNVPSVPWERFHRFAWMPKGDQVLVHSFLPLNIDDRTEELEREVHDYDVAVDISSGSYRKIASTEWPKSVVLDNLPIVQIRQALSKPPVLFVTDTKTGAQSMLKDLNPQFSKLEFGRVEAIEWSTTRGAEVEGGLYYPADYIPGRLYPLIIQTHGFVREEFSMDGRSEWSSGFAARPLAAKGFFVLQVGAYKNHLGEAEESTPAEAKLEVEKYEGAIDYLKQRQLIDDQSVGISGFSRTFYLVGCALIESRYHFAAASLVDGIDGSYLQFLMFGGADSVMLNGGFPFGQGLQAWLQRAPGFNLDKVRTPIRLVSTGSTGWLAQWEWFALLKDMRKPVDFIYLPDATHLIVKPSERKTAMQGLVDWFCFWVKGNEDSDPAKSEQYVRWRALKVAAVN